MYKDSVEFEHQGKKYTFKTEFNRMVHPFLQVWWYEPLDGLYLGSLEDAKLIAENIRKYNKGEYHIPQFR